MNPYTEFGRSQFRAPPTRCRFLCIHPPTSCRLFPSSPHLLSTMPKRSRVFTCAARRLRFRCRLSTPHCACGRFQPRHHAPRRSAAEAERSGVTKRCDCDLFGWWSARSDVTLDPCRDWTLIPATLWLLCWGQKFNIPFLFYDRSVNHTHIRNRNKHPQKKHVRVKRPWLTDKHPCI